MKIVIYLLLGLSLAAGTQLQADDSTIEEVTVTASLIDELSTPAENPIHVLSGDDLSNGYETILTLNLTKPNRTKPNLI